MNTTPVSNPNKDQNGAPFNMAITTLQALAQILEDYKVTLINPDLSAEEKQKICIDLVGVFFMRASPLLKQQIRDTYYPQVQLLEMKVARVFKGSNHTYQGKREVYNDKTKKECDKILIDLQISLQEDGYFMPPKNDPRFAFKRE